jgi:uncharacterized protein (TIGR02231 family)
VQAATIFPTAVSIRRAAQQHFVQGEHALRFGPLPTGIIDQSVRLNGVGPGLITEGFTIRTGTLGEANQQQISSLTEILLGLRAQHARALTERESLVRGIDPRQLQGVRGLAEVELRLRSLSAAISTRAAELEQLRSTMNTPVKYVIVDVTASRDGDAQLTLDYLMPNAGTWTPSYMAYLSADGATVALDVFAGVQQSTGEDWTGVRLTVSSVNPAGAVALPVLQERTIALGPEPEREVPAAAEMQPRPMARESSMARPSARSADDTLLSIAEPAPTPIEHRAAVVRANLLSARLEIATPVSLRSGALPRRVLAAHSELPCTIEHQAAPRLASSVFLAAKVRNHNAFSLLSGPVALFVEREYVGTTTMPDVPVDEEVFVPFGIDPSVTVDRTLAAHAAARQGARDQSSVRYDYRVSNHRDRPVDLVVFEQLPVSRSAGLIVRTSADTRSPSARREQDAPGTLRWNLHLPSGASERWHLGMLVDSPHGREIEGETN